MKIVVQKGKVFIFMLKLKNRSFLFQKARSSDCKNNCIKEKKWQKK